MYFESITLSDMLVFRDFTLSRTRDLVPGSSIKEIILQISLHYTNIAIPLIIVSLDYLVRVCFAF